MLSHAALSLFALLSPAQAEAINTAPAEARIAFSPVQVCHVTRDYELRCLGVDSSPPGPATKPPTGSFRQVVALNAGFCALRKSGEVICWTSGVSYPLPVFSGRYVQLASTEIGVCARTDDGKLDCATPLGTSLRAKDGQHVAQRSPLQDVKNIRSGTNICGETKRDAFCLYGSNQEPGFALGRKDSIGKLRGDFIKTVFARNLQCALRKDGVIVCKGYRLPETPSTQLPEFQRRGDFDRLVGGTGICARTRDGVWMCPFSEVEIDPQVNLHGAIVKWDGIHGTMLRGLTDDGQLNLPGFEGEIFEAAVVRPYRACGLRADDTLRCRGALPKIDTQELASGEYPLPYLKVFAFPRTSTAAVTIFGRRQATRDRDRALLAQKPKTKFTEVQIGNGFGCGLKKNGRLRCWGTIRGKKSLARAPLGRYRAFALGGVTGVAIKKNGRLVAWGSDYFHVKTNLPKGRFVGLRSSYLNHCAEHNEGGISCWGQAFYPALHIPGPIHSYALAGAGVCYKRTKTSVVKCEGNGYLWGIGPKAEADPT